MTFLSPPPPPAGLHSPASSAPWRMPASPHASSRIPCTLVLCVDVASDTHEGYPLCRPMVIGLDCWGKEEIVSGILKPYFNISSCEVIYPVFFLFVCFLFFSLSSSLFSLRSYIFSNSGDFMSANISSPPCIFSLFSLYYVDVDVLHVSAPYLLVFLLCTFISSRCPLAEYLKPDDILAY